jgi:hypothetical protein
MLHAAPLDAPDDVAFFLASYAREALARIELVGLEPRPRLLTPTIRPSKPPPTLGRRNSGNTNHSLCTFALYIHMCYHASPYFTGVAIPSPEEANMRSTADRPPSSNARITSPRPSLRDSAFLIVAFAIRNRIQLTESKGPV